MCPITAMVIPIHLEASKNIFQYMQQLDDKFHEGEKSFTVMALK